MSERHHTKRRRDRGGPQHHAAPREVKVGAKVKDTVANRVGVVLDTARQYAHPQARPVHSYLIRWQDGLVGAISEEAFRRGYGFVLVEEAAPPHSGA